MKIQQNRIELVTRPVDYESVAVGKWHLGSHREIYTPTKRGFSSHLGYWTGRIDYYDHSAEEIFDSVVRHKKHKLTLGTNC